eukprot:Hpha_TRINITY_DN16802_c2_g7::TRINITY_DN16802_c2_g7_i1::g.151100::m.151100
MKLGRWQKQVVKAPADVTGGKAAGAPPLRGRAHHAAVALEEEGRATSRVVVVGGREQSQAGPSTDVPPSFVLDMSELGVKGYQPTLLNEPSLGPEAELGEAPGVVSTGRTFFVAGGLTATGKPRKALTRCDMTDGRAEWKAVCNPRVGGSFGRDEMLCLAGHAVTKVRAQGADWIYTFGGSCTDPSGGTTLTNQVFRRRAGEGTEPFELFRTGNMVPSARRDAAIVHLPVGTQAGSGYILMWGGRCPGGACPDNDVHILSIDDRSWYTVEVNDDPALADLDGGGGGCPGTSYGHTMELVGHSVLILGGADTAESSGQHLVLNPLTSLWMLRFDDLGGMRWLREGEHFRMGKDDDAQIALEGGRHFHSTCMARAKRPSEDQEQNCIILIGGVNQSADITGQGHVMTLWLNDSSQVGLGPLPDPDLRRVKHSVFCAGLAPSSGLCNCSVM